MRYKYIFFDLDGTVIDSYEAAWATILDTLQEHNLPLIPEDERTLGIKNVYKKHAHLADPRALRNTHLKFQEKYFHKNTLYPRVIETLTRLKKEGASLAVITTSNKLKADYLLKTLHLDQFFEVVITEADVKNLKPHTEPFEKAAERLGIGADKKHQMLMVGDTEVDILGAHNYGIHVVAVTYSTYGQSVRDHNPTYTIDTFDKLLSTVEITK